MQGLEIFQAQPGSAEQNVCIPMLALCFDEFVDIRKKYGDRMPFSEISYIARSHDGRIAGHVGIMPVTVHAGEGRTIRLAGVASVAVHPDFRRRGIAAALCEEAASRAESDGFSALPLYTGLNRVYASCGWENFRMKSVTLVNPSCAEKKGKSGAELTDAEKEVIISSYEKAAVFPGQVLRTRDTFFHSWERMFGESFFTWYTDAGGYALEYAGFVAEASSAAHCGAVGKAFLSPADPLVQELLSAGWLIEAENDNAPACWAGENVMLRSCCSDALPADLFFSLADKI